jgi:hypothetical protein
VARLHEQGIDPASFACLWHRATLGETWVWITDGTTKVSETWAGTVPDTGYQIVRGK